MALYQSLMDRLGTQHEALGPIIVPLDRERLHRQPAPEKWSIHDNIAHLVATQPFFIDRLETILREEEPVLRRYHADDDPAFAEWRSRDTDDLLPALYRDRQTLFELVTTLDEENLARAGRHPLYGRLSVLQWTEFFLLHESHHIFTVFRMAHEGR